ncbi:hypothetical protein ZWY2020_056804 [Hordeum vulgare]|nr:hypothetical protein ZWY2020_056804 [Hordeum vulgare]
MRAADGARIGIRQRACVPRRLPARPAAAHNAAQSRPEVDDTVRLAAEGAPFTVTYYPRQGAREFVVPKQEVEEALVGAWRPGVQVRMKFLDAEERRSEWINGVVKAGSSRPGNRRWGRGRAGSRRA